MKSTLLRLSALASFTLAAWPAVLPAMERVPQPAAQPAAPATAGAHALLGVITERVSDDLRHQVPALRPGGGLIVRDVLADGPAATAGIRCFDILHLWNDQVLVHPEQLKVLVASAKPGDQVTLEFIRQGAPAKVQLVLAARSDCRLPLASPGAAVPPALPPALSGLLQNPELLRQAADAAAQAGIDPAKIAEALGKANLDPDKLQGLQKLAEQAASITKIVIVMPDGTRKEIPLDGQLKEGAKLDEILKNLDLSTIDPAALLGSKILLVRPDGSEQQITPADLLKNTDAINQLLQGLNALGQP